ncbi:MAG: hypothetical protein RI925_662 [Pseudomonadota bacterium]|jgi:hypothetical protein
MDHQAGLEEQCPHCHLPVPALYAEIPCPHCGHPLKAPNVRAAQREQQVLAQRHTDALHKYPDKAQRFDGFMHAINQCTTAVIARSASDCLRLAANDNLLYANYYQQIGSTQRIPSSSPFDTMRLSVDGLLFPFYEEHILMAALSADGWGLPHYGDCHLEIKPEMIASRSSVFEQNSLLFLTQVLKPTVGAPAPTGHRACWEERGKLAVVKHQDDLSADTPPDHYPALLLSPGTQQGQDDQFIEVHIYGSLSIRSVAAVRLTSSAESFYVKGLREKLAPLNILCEQQAA